LAADTKRRQHVHDRPHVRGTTVLRLWMAS
jgi:hypothetical protein